MTAIAVELLAPAFTAADPAHINLFASASTRLWEDIAQDSQSD